MPDINVNAGKIPVWYYALGAGGLYVAYTLYRRFTTPATPAAEPAAPAPIATATGIIPSGSYGRDFSGELANINQQLASMNRAQSVPASSSAASITPITATAANSVLSGAGYQPNQNQQAKQFTPVTSGGKIFITVTDLLQAATLGGQNLFYQPQPGVFALIPGGSVNSLAAGTPFFRQVT
jgi:hypothetical protein